MKTPQVKHSCHIQPVYSNKKGLFEYLEIRFFRDKYKPDRSLRQAVA